MLETCTKKDLMENGFCEYQAREIIRLARLTLVKRGCIFYSSKGRGRVPCWVVEELLGFNLVIGKEKQQNRAEKV